MRYNKERCIICQCGKEAIFDDHILEVNNKEFRIFKCINPLCTFHKEGILIYIGNCPEGHSDIERRDNTQYYCDRCEKQFYIEDKITVKFTAV